MVATFLGGPGRTSAFVDSFVKAPAIVWARVEHPSGGSEWNGGPVVDDDIAVAVGSGYRCEVAALDPASGTTRWRVDPPTKLKQTFATAGNLIADGVVYFGSNEGLHALDANDGSPRWLAKIRGLHGAPLALGDTIVVTAGTRLVAFDRTTGRKVWTYSLDAQSRAAAASRNGTLYAHGNDSLLALDAESRTVRWTIEALSGPALSAGPAVTADRVLFVDNDHALACVDRETGNLLWATKPSDSPRAHPFAVSAECVVVKTLGGRLECFDLATGVRRWSSAGGRETPVSIGHCGPIIAGTTVVCVMVDNSRARCTLTGLDLATGSLLWELDNAPVAAAIADEQKQLGSGYDGTWSWYCTPLVHRGTLYVQADAGLVALR